MFAGIYRDFAGKSECRDFKFMGIACIPAIPVIFEVNHKKVWTFYIYSSLKFFKFPYNFCRDFRRTCIPVIITCTLQGTFCNTGIPCTFYGGKICSAWINSTVIICISSHKYLRSNNALHDFSTVCISFILFYYFCLIIFSYNQMISMNN